MPYLNILHIRLTRMNFFQIIKCEKLPIYQSESIQTVLENRYAFYIEHDHFRMLLNLLPINKWRNGPNMSWNCFFVFLIFVPLCHAFSLQIISNHNNIVVTYKTTNNDHFEISVTGQNMFFSSKFCVLLNLEGIC